MRTQSFLFTAACTALLCGGATATFAADACTKPLQMVNTVPLKMSDDKLRAYVPVTINGTEKTFMLDTGGFASQVRPSVAAELKLPTDQSGGRILDMYGHAAESEVLVDSFVLGRLQARKTELLVSTSTFDDPKVPFAGILAADFMGRYDTELDFASGKMNYFSPDHCEGKVIYWPMQVFAVVPMKFGDDHHVVIPVTLDGHAFRATIDTGAPFTIIDAAEAKRVFGIADAGPNDTALPDVNGDKRFMHIFDALDFDGVAIGKPRIVVFPNEIGRRDPNNGKQTGSLIKQDDDQEDKPAITIGMNVLSKLHLYIAFQERKLYITPGAAPAPAAKAP